MVGELSPGGNDPETDVRSDRRRGMVPIRLVRMKLADVEFDSHYRKREVG